MAARIALHLLRVFIGGLFIYAGALKAWDTRQFAFDVQNYQIIPWPDATLLLALYLPWLEIVCGLALLARRLYLGALGCLLLLDLIFLGAIGSAWRRGLDITCGCFGGEVNATNFPLLFTRDLLLLAALAILLTAAWKQHSPQPSEVGSRSAGL